MNYRITPDEALATLRQQEEFPFAVMLKQGTMTLEYYAPVETDKQTPHKQDELYFIISGTSIFNRNGERTTCKQGDVLWVPAGMEHRFENFSQDFSTWVVFYGADGGEQPGQE